VNRELDGMKLKASTEQLHSILEKVNNGTGTLGALVNDPGLYYDARALLGGANRNRIVRNLVRQTIKDAEEDIAPTDKELKGKAPSSSPK
jgi:phospholipid/cholesterol/gamma-HCH transport system substrate-binding protein